MARLPQVGGDTGNWGEVLNEFLSVGHNPGGTLKTFPNSVFNVKDYGAKGDNNTYDTAAIQAANEAAKAARIGGYACATVYFPSGHYWTREPIIAYSGILYKGAGAYSTLITNNDSDIFRGQPGLNQAAFEDLAFIARGGNVFFWEDASLIQMNRCRLSCESNSHSALRVTNILIDCLFQSLWVKHLNTSTVPTFYLESNVTGINCNTIRKCRFEHAGNYAISIESLNTQGYCYDNTIEDLNLEVMEGGCIRLLSCMNNKLENCVLYDTIPANIKKSPFLIGRSGTTGLSSKYNVIKRCHRRNAGILAANVYDIQLQAGYAPLTTIEDCDTSTLNTFKIDLGNNSGVIHNMLNPVFTNVAAGTVNLRNLTKT